MVRRFITLLCGLIFYGLTSLTLAADLPSYRPPADEVITGQIFANDGDSRRPISIAAIERLPMVELDGRATPDEPTTRFQGPLLKDVLNLIGAADASQITVRASDGYAAEIPRQDWERWPLVLATRAEGKPLTVRRRGPARILYPSSLYSDLTQRIYVDRSIWLLSEIEW